MVPKSYNIVRVAQSIYVYPSYVVRILILKNVINDMRFKPLIVLFGIINNIQLGFGDCFFASITNRSGRKVFGSFGLYLGSLLFSFLDSHTMIYSFKGNEFDMGIF